MATEPTIKEQDANERKEKKHRFKAILPLFGFGVLLFLMVLLMMSELQKVVLFLGKQKLTSCHNYGMSL